MKLGDMVQSCNPSTGDAEAGGWMASFEVSLSCNSELPMLARATNIVV